MELTIVNMLYLELSQVATAKTKNDLELDCVQKVNDRRGKLLADIANCDEVGGLPTDLKARIVQELNPRGGIATKLLPPLDSPM